MSARIIDMVGQQIGQLKVVSFSHKDSGGNYQWVTRCSCGNIRVVQGSQLRAGKVESCHQCQLKARQDKKAAEEVFIFKNEHEAQDMEFIVRLEEILLSMQENERALQDFSFEFRQVMSDRR
jgi:hypothetical protein